MNDNRKSWHVTPPYLLGIAFVVLKLCKVIDWSWWLVTLPFWIPFALALVVLVVLASAKMLLEVIVAMFGRK